MICGCFLCILTILYRRVINCDLGGRLSCMRQKEPEKKDLLYLKLALRIFESVFCKSLIRACSFGNSLAASQNARTLRSNIQPQALRICKKRIQKLLMLPTLNIINLSSQVLSVSYNGTLFKPLQDVHVKRY